MKTRLQAYLDGELHDFNHILRSKEQIKHVRLMLMPEDRVAFVRRFYQAVSKAYSCRFGQECVDAAFEAFILGFVDKLDLISVMRIYHDELYKDEELPF